MSTTNTPFFVPLFKNGHEYCSLKLLLLELRPKFRQWLRGKALAASGQVFDRDVFEFQFNLNRQRLIEHIIDIELQEQRAMDEDLQAILP